MARPKTKSALVDGMTELVDSLRNIESQLGLLLKSQKRHLSAGPGRPAGSGRKPGRPAGSGRGPGRPAKSGRKPGRPAGKAKAKPGRPRRRGRGRPPGSKNK